MILTKPDGRTTEVKFEGNHKGLRADKIIFTEQDVKAARTMKEKQGIKAVQEVLASLS